MLKDRIKLDLEFDAQKLQTDLAEMESSEWIEHFVTQNYEGDWKVIPLRGPKGATHPVKMIYSDPTCSEFSDTPFLAKSENFREVMNAFQCPLQAVRLMKLSPGSRIKEHTDLDLDAESGTARIHIPVITNDKVEFRLNGTRVTMREGECWYLRLSDPHSVVNGGQSERVHLVIDALVNPWLTDLLKKG